MSLTDALKASKPMQNRALAKGDAQWRSLFATQAAYNQWCRGGRMPSYISKLP